MAATKSGNHGAGSKWIIPARRLGIYIRDEFTCCYCGVSLKNSPAAEVTLDHLTPRSAGGNNESTNLVTACRSCNSSRGDKPYADYATGGARDRIETRRHQAVNLELAKGILSDRIAGLVADVEGQR